MIHSYQGKISTKSTNNFLKLKININRHAGLIFALRFSSQNVT